MQNLVVKAVGKSRHSSYVLALLDYLENRFKVTTSIEPATETIRIHNRKGLHKDTIEDVELAIEVWDTAFDQRAKSKKAPLEGFSAPPKN